MLVSKAVNAQWGWDGGFQEITWFVILSSLSHARYISVLSTGSSQWSKMLCQIESPVQQTFVELDLLEYKVGVINVIQ